VATKRSIIDIDSLTEAERIQLAEDLWDSIAPDSPELALTPAMRALLRERVAEHRRDPGPAEPAESVLERIQLAQDLWDSIPPDSPEIAVPPWTLALLDERLAEMERNPDGGEPREVVRERLLAGLRERRRTGVPRKPQP